MQLWADAPDSWRVGNDMVAGISHFAIKVRDLAAAERFYCDVLGLVVTRRWPSATGAGERSLWVSTGDVAGAFLALELVTEAQPSEAQTGASVPIAAVPGPEAAGHHLVALRIRQDDRAWYETRLAACGVAVSHRTAFTLYFVDPEGNRLALSHYPDAVSGPSALPSVAEST